MQWWRYRRKKCAFVGTTVHRRPVKTNRRNLRHALAYLKTWLREWNKWLWKTATWLWDRQLPMPAYPLDLWTPCCLMTWNCGKITRDGFHVADAPFGLFSHDIRPSVNCRTHEHTFFTSITPSLHVSLNCWWISMGFMPRERRNRIITPCSSNVNVTIFSI